METYEVPKSEYQMHADNVKNLERRYELVKQKVEDSKKNMTAQPDIFGDDDEDEIEIEEIGADELGAMGDKIQEKGDDALDNILRTIDAGQALGNSILEELMAQTEQLDRMNKTV